jgi:hypothetical protein
MCGEGALCEMPYSLRPAALATVAFALPISYNDPMHLRALSLGSRLPLALALGLAACGDPATTKSDAASDDTSIAVDTADTADSVDAPATEATPTDITAVLSEYVSTVVIVRWHTDIPTIGHVEFGEPRGGEPFRLRTPNTEPSTEHEVLLLGLYADTEFNFRVVTDSSDSGGEADSQASRDLAITTGSLPAGLFPLRVTGEATSWSGYQVLPLQGSSYAIAVVDAWGRYVWWHLVEQEGNLMRGVLSVDGKSMVYLLAGPQNHLEESKIVRVSLDGGTVVEEVVEGADHDFTELPDGTLAVVVVERGADPGRTADTIVEISPTGQRTKVWSAWDSWSPATFPSDPNGNWTHANAIDYVAADDSYYFGMKNLGGMVKIDRASGEVLWAINGVLNEFTFTDGSNGLELCHQFEVQDDGHILFFENGDRRGYSLVREVEVDVDSRTATPTWEFNHNPPLMVFAKGDVHRFEDGNVQVVWSTSGEIQNVTPEGDVTWQLNLDLGQVVTFVQIVDSFYGP